MDTEGVIPFKSEHHEIERSPSTTADEQNRRDDRRPHDEHEEQDDRFQSVTDFRQVEKLVLLEEVGARRLMKRHSRRSHASPRSRRLRVHGTHSEMESCLLNFSNLSQRLRSAPTPRGPVKNRVEEARPTASLDIRCELKREGRASLVRRDGMHSNELAQNSPGIVFGIGYLTLCKIRGIGWHRGPGRVPGLTKPVPAHFSPPANLLY